MIKMAGRNTAKDSLLFLFSPLETDVRHSRTEKHPTLKHDRDKVT